MSLCMLMKLHFKVLRFFNNWANNMYIKLESLLYIKQVYLVLNPQIMAFLSNSHISCTQIVINSCISYAIFQNFRKYNF